MEKGIFLALNIFVIISTYHFKTPYMVLFTETGLRRLESNQLRLWHVTLD